MNNFELGLYQGCIWIHKRTNQKYIIKCVAVRHYKYIIVYYDKFSGIFFWKTKKDFLKKMKFFKEPK